MTFKIQLLIIFGLGVVAGLHVKVFKDYRYKGLIYDETFDVFENELNCHDLDSYARGRAGSLKTDTCLILYDSVGCKGNSVKVSQDMTEKLAQLGEEVSSFHPCNKDIGGTTIRVDMMDASSNIIAKYYDVCGCQDLPTQVQTQLTQLNNYGNCITVYSTDTCGGENEIIPAGQNRLSQHLPQLGYYVRSISGCGSKRSCTKLHSEIFKFNLLPDPSSENILSEPKEVALSTKTMFYNNGSAKVFQEYEATETVRQSATIRKSKSFYAFSSMRLDAGVNGSVSGDHDVGRGNQTFGKVSAAASGYLNYAYAQESESTVTEDTEYTYEEEKQFRVRQVIEVPACVKYEVSSTVEVVENFPIIYEIFTRVTGESSGHRVTAEEIVRLVDDLTFVEILDEYTAVFKTAEKLEASVGVTTRISGEGYRIPGCLT